MTYIKVVSFGKRTTLVSDLLCLFPEMLVHTEVAPGVQEVAFWSRSLGGSGHWGELHIDSLKSLHFKYTK